MAKKQLKDARRAQLFAVAVALHEKGILTKVVKKHSTNIDKTEATK